MKEKDKKKNKSNVQDCNHCDCENKISESNKKNEEDIVIEDSEQDEEKENKED